MWDWGSIKHIYNFKWIRNPHDLIKHFNIVIIMNIEYNMAWFPHITLIVLVDKTYLPLSPWFCSMRKEILEKHSRVGGPRKVGEKRYRVCSTSFQRVNWENSQGWRNYITEADHAQHSNAMFKISSMSFALVMWLKCTPNAKEQILSNDH